MKRGARNGERGMVAGLVLLLLAGCVGRPAGRQASRPAKTISVPLPGGGTYALEQRRLDGVSPHLVQPRFKASAERLRRVPWRYDLPQGTVPSNWWWNLERSFDLRTWSLVASNVTGEPNVGTTNRMEFFRLKGRL